MAEINDYIAELVLQSLAFILNVLTVGVIIGCKKLRKQQNIFTCNIALADGLSAVLVIFSTGQIYTGFKREHALWVILTFRSIYFIGIFSTLAVALHRFIIIRFDPFNKRNLVTPPRCIILCVIIWAVPFATFFSFDINSSITIIRIALPALIFASNGLSTVSYALVYWAIASAARKAGLADRMLVQRIKQNKKVLTTFALVVGTNVLCWTPYCLCNFIAILRPDLAFANNDYTPWFGVVYPLSRGIQSLNGVLNPIIYWTRLTDFRQLLKEICQCSRNKDDEGTMSKRNNVSNTETSLQREKSSMATPKDHDDRHVKVVSMKQNSYIIET